MSLVVHVRRAVADRQGFLPCLGWMTGPEAETLLDAWAERGQRHIPPAKGIVKMPGSIQTATTNCLDYMRRPIPVQELSLEDPLSEEAQVLAPLLAVVAMRIDVPDVRHIVLLEVRVHALADRISPSLFPQPSHKSFSFSRAAADRGPVLPAASYSVPRKTRRPRRTCPGEPSQN